MTPNTAEWATKLNQDCPCNGKWKAGTERQIVTCSPASCPNTEWLGGLTGNQANGIEVGKPAFGFSSADSKEISLSYLDSSYSIGMALTTQDVWQTIPRQEPCSPIVSKANSCGLWNARCAPDFTFGGQASRSEFVYEGPAKTVRALQPLLCRSSCVPAMSILALPLLLLLPLLFFFFFFFFSSSSSSSFSPCLFHSPHCLLSSSLSGVCQWHLQEQGRVLSGQLLLHAPPARGDRGHLPDKRRKHQH